LAKELGIEIDTTKGLRYKEIYEANELASQFYSICLSKQIGRRGQNYLKVRKIDLNKLKGYRLGYAPASGGLVTFMKQKGVSFERLNKAGLITANNEVFRDRIIFPIFNLSGRVIGFGGRGIDDYMQPKYLNSPETPIFKKGGVLYGLHQAKENMRTKGNALLVEGYFDLLSLAQSGIQNVCAPLGTSLTENQATLISRFVKKVNILFDGDLSGIKAALRAIGLLINAQVDVYVTSLPEDSDPDKFINQAGVEGLNELISAAPDFFHFYKKVVTAETVEQEIALIKDLIQIVSNIRDPIRFDRYVKYISHVFEISEETIEKEMGMKTEVVETAPSRTSLSAEERLMAMILNNRANFPHAKETLKPNDFTEDGIKRIYKVLLKNENFDIYDLSDVIDESLREKLLSVIMKEDPVSEEGFSKAVIRYKHGVEEKRLRKKIEDACKSGDDDAVMKYQEKLNKLKKKLLNLKVD
jgi:DNA primase